MVETGDFRRDLFARLAGARVALPPLRARREDVGLLLRRFLVAACGRADAANVGLTQRAAAALLAYDWPLNVRELEKAVSTAVVRASRGPAGAHVAIDVAHLPGPIAAAADGSSSSGGAGGGGEATSRRAKIVALLRAHGGNVSSVARELGTTRTQIHRWARRYGIDLDAFRP